MYDKQGPSASTADDQPKKSKRPPDAVSISPGGTRYLSEAEGHEKWLRLWKRGVWTDSLTAVGGVVITISASLAVGERNGHMK